MASEVVWRPPWPLRPLEAICTWRVLRVADFKSEAAMASETTTASEAVRGNMHMDTRVIKVADFKSEVK